MLVTGASTAVGRMLLHFLGKEDLTPIGLARSKASARRVATELASSQLVATQDADWQHQVTSLAAERKIVGVLDCVSGSLPGDLVPLLANDAVIVMYGGLGGDTRLGITNSILINRQFVIRGANFTRWFSEVPPDERAEDVRSAFKLASEGPSLFKVGSIYGLADFKDAIASVLAPNRDGYVFLKP